MEKYATKYSIFGNYCQVFPTGAKEWAAKTFYAHFATKYCHIRQVVQILHQIDPKHPFQIVGLISALSFVIARSDQADPFSPRYDSVDLC